MDDKTLKKKLEKLNQFESVKNYNKKDKDKVLKYVVLVYDSESDYLAKYPNLIKRKDAVFKEVGLRGARAEELRMMDDEGAVDIVNDLLRLIDDRTWQLIVMHSEAFIEYQHQILTQVISDKSKEHLQALEVKNKLLKSCDEIDERLTNYYHRFYKNDDNLASKSKAARAKRFSPEALANRT